MMNGLSNTILRAATALDRQTRLRPPQGERIDELVVAMLSPDFVDLWSSPLDLARALAMVSPAPIVTVEDLRRSVRGFAERLRSRLDVDAPGSLQACLDMHEIACRPGYQP